MSAFSTVNTRTLGRYTGCKKRTSLYKQFCQRRWHDRLTSPDCKILQKKKSQRRASDINLTNRLVVLAPCIFRLEPDQDVRVSVVLYIFYAINVCLQPPQGEPFHTHKVPSERQEICIGDIF
jgi:hypothetical protein